jgi:hypothetical protein
MKFRNYFTLIFAAASLLLSATSCLDTDDEDYAEWRQQNDEYLQNIDLNEYTRVIPDWAPNNSVYIKWHNDTTLTSKNLVAMSTSTVNIKYEMEDINGKALSNSYSMTTNGDSIYQSMPNENIVGMWAAMTTLHEGDSVTLIIPYNSAYGASGGSNFDPYSNLIYHMKLKKIVSYEKEN